MLTIHTYSKLFSSNHGESFSVYVCRYMSWTYTHTHCCAYVQYARIQSLKLMPSCHGQSFSVHVYRYVLFRYVWTHVVVRVYNMHVFNLRSLISSSHWQIFSVYVNIDLLLRVGTIYLAVKRICMYTCTDVRICIYGYVLFRILYNMHVFNIMKLFSSSRWQFFSVDV